MLCWLLVIGSQPYFVINLLLNNGVKMLIARCFQILNACLDLLSFLLICIILFGQIRSCLDHTRMNWIIDWNIFRIILYWFIKCTLLIILAVWLRIGLLNIFIINIMLAKGKLVFQINLTCWWAPHLPPSWHQQLSFPPLQFAVAR